MCLGSGRTFLARARCTMILSPEGPCVPDVVTAGLDTVGQCAAPLISVPRDHQRCGCPRGRTLREYLWAAQSHLRRPYVGGYGWKD